MPRNSQCHMTAINATFDLSTNGSIHLPILPSAARIARFCRERRIHRLSLFGSAARGDFVPRQSDVDLLVEYMPGCHPGIGHFKNADDLSEMFGVRVDLNTPAMLGRFLHSVSKEASIIYDDA